MKKLYAFATMIVAVTCANAQNSVDFETYPIGAESFDNGINAQGYFIFNDVYLSNVYDTAWGSWTGFSISIRISSLPVPCNVNIRLAF